MNWKGIRIPYVALWSSESERYVAPDRVMLEGRPALFNRGERGDGAPILGKMSDHRQRECVCLLKCQVCRRRLGPPYLAIDAERQLTVHHGRELPLLIEPMVCLRCAAYSLETCPGISRMRESGRLRIYEIRRFEHVMTWLAPCPGSPYPDLDRILTDFGKPVVGMVKIMPTRYRVIDESVIRSAKRPLTD